MSLLNKRKVKQLVRDHGKQCSAEFLDQLDHLTWQRIENAIRRLPKSAKRLKASELL